MKWAGHVARMGWEIYTIMVEKPEERLLGRPRCRWEYSIRMDLTVMRWEGVDWINLAQDSDQRQGLVNTV
jgi:hypothetical protein